jgi:hypothetical protein
VWAKARISTMDNAFPFDKVTRCFTSMWVTMLNESLRETRYMAELGGNHYNISEMYEHINVQFHTYNENYLVFLQ